MLPSMSLLLKYLPTWFYIYPLILKFHILYSFLYNTVSFSNLISHFLEYSFIFHFYFLKYSKSGFKKNLCWIPISAVFYFCSFFHEIFSVCVFTVHYWSIMWNSSSRSRMNVPSFRKNFLLPLQDQITKFMAPCSLDHPNPDLKFLGIMSPQPHFSRRSFSPILLTSVPLGARTTFPFSTLDIWEGRYIAGFLLLWKWHCFNGEEVFC